jgi:hypothetical protein
MQLKSSHEVIGIWSTGIGQQARVDCCPHSSALETQASITWLAAQPYLSIP